MTTDRYDTFDESQLAAWKTEFEREGFIRVPDVLTDGELDRLNSEVDRLVAEEEEKPGHNFFGVIRKSDAFLDLVTHPKSLPLIVRMLDFNIQTYMTHLSVRFPHREGGEGESKPSQTGWHMDGPTPYPHGVDGVIPILSLKICYLLSDLSEPERGNTKIIPRSHRRAHYSVDDRDPTKPVEGELQVTGRAGDAFLFAQNLWHAAAPNLSQMTRRVCFMGYSYMWIRPLDDYSDILEARPDLSSEARQLLGGCPEKDHYFAKDKELPLEKLAPRAESVAAG